MGESGLLRAEVAGTVVHAEAMAKREPYFVSWSVVSVRKGGGFAMLRGRRKGVVMTPDGSVLFTVAFSGTEVLDGCKDDDCACSDIADPFTCFPSNIEDCVDAGAAMSQPEVPGSVIRQRAVVGT